MGVLQVFLAIELLFCINGDPGDAGAQDAVPFSDDEIEEIEEEDMEDIEFDDDPVQVLTNDNYKEFINEHENVLVDFYAPWCDFCKELEPIWAKAAQILRVQGLKIRLAKMNVIKEDRGEQYAEEGYPTVRLFSASNWNMQDWWGIVVRDFQLEDVTIKPDHIVRYAIQQEFRVPKEIEKDMIDSAISKVKPGQFALVACVKENSARAKAFWQIQDELKTFNGAVFWLFVVWLPEEARPKEDSWLFMWRPGFETPDKVSIDFGGAWTTGNIAKWARRNAFATVNRIWVDELWDQSNTAFIGLDIQVAALFDKASLDLKDDLHSQLWAFKNSSSASGVLLLDYNGLSAEDKQYFNPQGSSLPLLMVVAPSKGGKFVLSGRDKLAKADSIKRFIADVKSDKARRILQSEPVPKILTDKDGVTTLVGDTFYDNVLNRSKDVFVQYWDDSCAPCKKLEPTWRAVAKKIKEKYGDSVMVAKLNKATNGHTEVLTALPTLVLYPAVKAEKKFKNKVVYKGNFFTFDKIMAFLEQNAINIGGDEEL